MKREFALSVERSDGIWSVQISDEQGQGVRSQFGNSLQYALLDAISFIASRFQPERNEA